MLNLNLKLTLSCLTCTYTYPRTLTAPAHMPTSKAVQGRIDRSADAPIATPPARVASDVERRDESLGGVRLMMTSTAKMSVTGVRISVWIQF